MSSVSANAEPLFELYVSHAAFACMPACSRSRSCAKGRHELGFIVKKTEKMETKSTNLDIQTEKCSVFNGARSVLAACVYHPTAKRMTWIR